MRPSALLLRLLCPALLAVAACGPKYIGETEIPNTEDNRAIVDVIAAYKKALEARDVDAIMALVSPGFFETSGTPEGSDDYDRAGLERKLTDWFSHVRALKADIRVKSIDVTDDKASARYFFEFNYQIAPPGELPVWKREADTAEMRFVLEDGAWKVVAGL